MERTKAEPVPAGTTIRPLAAAGLAGLGTMAIELSAVRLIAPWFGTSQAVWTSAIGAVLVALTVGYLLGARWALGPRPEARLSACLWLSGAWAFALPAFAPWIAARLVPASANLEQVAGSLPLTSLACSLCLFFPPAALLATAGPLVVELLARRTGAAAGAVGGKVLACSTAGSLVGTFGTTYFAIPVLGVQGALWLSAALICLAAVLASGLGRHHAAGSFSLVAMALSFAGEAPAQADLIALEESPYQQVRVVDLGAGWRSLEVNEQRGSFQSVMAPGPGLIGRGYYYDYFALPSAWSRANGEWSLLVLGLGAGTAVRVLEGALPDGAHLRSLGVELDPSVVNLARAHMAMAPEREGRRALGGWDARVALGPLVAAGERWDQIVVDVYANQVEIPPHLATREYFEVVRSCLADTGWLQVNVGAADAEDPLVLAVGATMSEVFAAPTLALEVAFSRNVVLVQRLGAPVVSPEDDSFRLDGEGLAGLSIRASLPGVWAWIHPDDGMVLSDQDAPLEALQRSSLARIGGSL